MLERIFLSVLSTSLVTSFIIILLLILAPLINKRYAAKWKYWVWVLLALRLIMPVTLSDVHNAPGNLSQSLPAGVGQYESDATNLLQPEETLPPSQRIILEIPSEMTEPLIQSDPTYTHITVLTIMERIWLAGSIIILSVHLCSYLAYRRRIRLKGVQINDQTALELLLRLTDELQLKKHIAVIEYSGAGSPMVLGFIHPVLVMPAENYSDEELYFIFKHELIHYKRHDVCFKLLFVLANAVHWFNPVIWLMQREAIVDMELSCDERVMLDADYNARKSYTEILFSILHNRNTNKTPLSTQFYGGKQVMKKRFRNILEHSGKRNGLSILVCTLCLVMGLGFLIGCSVSESDRLEKTSGEEVALVGIVGDHVDVSDIILNHAKELVSEWYVNAQTDFPDYGYANWRIESLTHCHTYDDFEGIAVQVYQLNYELLSEKPENVMLAGGMSITEDGWVTPDYSNSRFLIFQQNGDNLSYLTYLFENDCYPPDEIFTDDLSNQLKAIGIIASSEEITFSCGVSGCTQTEEHQHGLCGIDGCTQIGEHSHEICSIAGCTETETHLHNGEYCYPHSADDGHAYHNCGVVGCTEVASHTHNSCGVLGCTEVGNHTHNSCGVAGCTQIGEHSHGGHDEGHHQSGHH